MTTANGYQPGEQIEAEALDLRGKGDEAQWAKCDLVARALADMTRGKMSAYQWFRRMWADGLSTIRLYERMGRVYPGAIRDEFDGALTWGQFRAAVSADDPIGVLRWACESADEWGGVPAPCDKIAAKVRELKDGHEKTDAERRRELLDRMGDTISALTQLFPANNGYRKRFGALADILAELEAGHNQLELEHK